MSRSTDARHRRWYMGIRPFERHSLVLMVAGTIFIFIGLAFATAPPTDGRALMLQYALKVMGYDQWGFVFMVVGILAVISSRWPPVSETWGYQAMTALSTGWSLLYLAGIWFGNSPVANYAGVLTWGLIAFMWWAISGLVNPDRAKALLRENRALHQENIELLLELDRLKHGTE